jgi:periplasmic protein CpxP/Spy
MTDEMTPEAVNPGDPVRSRPASGPGLGSGARRLLLGAAFAATFLAGGMVMSASPDAAFAQAPATTPTPTPAPAKGAAGGHGGVGAMADKLDQTLTKVDATADQKAKIKSIATTALISLVSLQPKAMRTPGELRRVLLGPTVDRAGLEQLRATLIADLDQASKTLVQALADAADVLTPDQRAKLGAVLAGQPHPHS